MIAALDDILARFAALVDEPEPVRSVRGVTLAVAQQWMMTLPECPEKAAAIDGLLDAMNLACTAAAKA